MNEALAQIQTVLRCIVTRTPYTGAVHRVRVIWFLFSCPPFCSWNIQQYKYHIRPALQFVWYPLPTRAL